MPQPDYRIHEMNKRLQQRTDDSDNLWWDAFATEFFEDDANLTLTFCLEDGPKRYSNEGSNFCCPLTVAFFLKRPKVDDNSNNFVSLFLQVLAVHLYQGISEAYSKGV